jgi:hypothetical protein
MKEVLNRAGIEWIEIDSDTVSLHEGWRGNGSTTYAAGLALNDRVFPVFFIGEKCVETSVAIRNLKLGKHLHAYRKEQREAEKA